MGGLIKHMFKVFIVKKLPLNKCEHFEHMEISETIY